MNTSASYNLSTQKVQFLQGGPKHLAMEVGTKF